MKSVLHKKIILLIGFLTVLVLVEGGVILRSKPVGKLYEVVETENGFVPAEIAIRAGDRVRFTTTANHFFWPASNPHPTHTDYPEFDPQQAIAAKDAWTFTFTKVGKWGYHDHLAPINTGTIIVTGSQNQTTVPHIPNLL